MAAVKGGKAALAQQSLAEGDRLRRERRLDDAEAAYRAALAESRDLIPALHGLSAVLRDLKRHDEALPVARHALELAPADPWRHVAVGNILGGQGKVAEAAKAYTAALDLDHYLAGVPIALAQALAASGAPPRRVAQAFGLAAAETPEDGPALHRTAEAWLAAGDPAEAVVWLRRALARGEEVTAPLARALLACGRREGLDLLAGHPANTLSLADEVTLLGLLPAVADRAAGRPTVACLPALIPLLDRGLPALRTVPRPANPALSIAAQVARLAPPGTLPPPSPWLQGAYDEARPGVVAIDRRGPVRPSPAFWALLDGSLAGWTVIRLDDIPEDEADKMAEAIGRCALVVSAGGLAANLAGALGKAGLVTAGNGWVWQGSGEASPFHPGLRLVRPDADGGWETAAGLLRALLAGELASPVASMPRQLPPPADQAASDQELADTLHRLPFPADALAHPIACRRLTLGFQNRTFRLDLGPHAYALRLAKFPSGR